MTLSVFFFYSYYLSNICGVHCVNDAIFYKLYLQEAERFGENPSYLFEVPLVIFIKEEPKKLLKKTLTKV